jgi:hypothetical protein
MKRGPKLLLVAAGAILATSFSATLLAGVVVYRSVRAGAAVVSVDENRPGGTHLWIPVPVVLLHTALAFVPDEHLPPLDAQARRCLPVAKASLEALAEAPDAVLVEVSNAHEHVRIEKRDGQIVVSVDSRDENVRVSVPAASLVPVLDRLIEAGSRAGRGRDTIV